MSSPSSVLERPTDLVRVRNRVETLVGTAFATENARLQEHRDLHTLSMSGIGGCLRWAAYTLAGTPPTETLGWLEAREAMLGTAIHWMLLPAMQRCVPGAEIEKPVVLRAAGMEIHGTLDWLWVDPATGEAEVGDLKTVREWKLNGVFRHGAYDEHRLQVFGYALAAAQAGYNVRWVWWAYLDRSTGQVVIVVEEFTTELAYAVVQRLTRIRQAAADPATARREARGPGFSPVCDRCPWLRACWGPTARPGRTGPQTILAVTFEGIVAALAGMHTASGAESAARADKDFYKAVLADVPDGEYGAYRLRRRRQGKRLKQAEARELLEAAGMPVPEAEAEKAVTVSIT